jgi:mRNA-degrading endonuclease toxin of MazEF toxin-antitoxin module
MPIPAPEPGLVISYAYLWRHEQQAGLEEGRKDRPCVVILAVREHDNAIVVTVAPITHRPITDKNVGLELPSRVKQHLGLDHEKSWVVVSEVNQFTWPGYDLRAIPGHLERYDYGFLPPHLFNRVKAAMLDLSEKRRLAIGSRN